MRVRGCASVCVRARVFVCVCACVHLCRQHHRVLLHRVYRRARLAASAAANVAASAARRCHESPQYASATEPGVRIINKGVQIIGISGAHNWNTRGTGARARRRARCAHGPRRTRRRAERRRGGRPRRAACRSGNGYRRACAVPAALSYRRQRRLVRAASTQRR